MFDVGHRVIHKASGRAAFVHAVRQKRAVMVEVRWESTGTREWLPADMFRPWDRLSAPPETAKTPASTTPAYLVALKAERAKHPERNRKKERQLAERQLAESLIELSDTRKNQTKMKAKKLIQNFDRNIHAANMKRRVTMKDIEAVRTKRGGFSRKSLAKLGLSWPPKKGWQKRLLRGEVQQHVLPRKTDAVVKNPPKKRTVEEWADMLPRLRGVLLGERIARDDRHDRVKYSVNASPPPRPATKRCDCGSRSTTD